MQPGWSFVMTHIETRGDLPWPLIVYKPAKVLNQNFKNVLHIHIY